MESALPEEPHLTVISNTEQTGHSGEHAPEALFISALLEVGQYIPGMYGIRDDQFSGHKPVHQFCTNYQATSKVAPPLNLLTKKFPNFPFEPNINPVWAATQLAEAHTNRMLRKVMAKASMAVAEEAHDEAIAMLRDTLSRITPAVSQGINATDMSQLEGKDDLVTCPVPAGMLSKITNGIGAGDLWYVAARLGVGKSWRLIQHAVTAAEAGWDVAYFSLEMPAKAVIDRIHRIALRNYTKPWPELELPERSELIEKWSQGKGTINIYDPSAGRCDAAVVSSVAGENTLVIVDYVGLMYTNSGIRSIEDWRAAATISNQLKEVALEHSVPIIAAAQINRSGESKGSGMPGAEHLAQSDALGQDADALITLKKYGQHALVNALTKYRHGESGAKWYTQFEPGKAKLGDISPEMANQLKALDEEADDF